MSMSKTRVAKTKRQSAEMRRMFEFLGKPIPQEIYSLFRAIKGSSKTRFSIAVPTEVYRGAVWSDVSGELTGDLETARGTLSFRSGVPGESLSPDPQLSFSAGEGCGEQIEIIRGVIESYASAYENDQALKSVVSIRDQLSECIRLAEDTVEKLAARRSLWCVNPHPQETVADVGIQTVEQGGLPGQPVNEPIADPFVACEEDRPVPISIDLSEPLTFIDPDADLLAPFEP
jgi:hypothetical protein